MPSFGIDHSLSLKQRGPFGPALSLNFASAAYTSRLGASTATLSSMPGYSYSRTGAKQERISGTFTSFAANTPGLVSGSGYFSRAAVTNQIPRSQTFDLWSVAATVTETVDATTAPDGTTSAEKVMPTASNVNHRVFVGGALGAGTFTFSVFAKAAGYPRIAMRVFDGTDYQIYATFDMSTGAGAGSVVANLGGPASITAIGNGWYLCTATGTSVSGSMGSSTGWDIDILDGTHTAQQAFAGDGTSGVYLWQGQVIIGTDTSANPVVNTTSIAATVGADVLSVTVPSGTYSAVYTFDDNSTQTISTTVASNTFTLATYPTLTRPLIKKVVLS